MEVCNKALVSLLFFLSDSLALNWLPASRPVRGSWISLLLKVLFCFSAGLTDCPWLPVVGSLCFVVAQAADSPGPLLTLSQPDSLAQRVLWHRPLWRHWLHLKVLCWPAWSSLHVNIKSVLLFVTCCCLYAAPQPHTQSYLTCCQILKPGLVTLTVEEDRK